MTEQFIIHKYLPVPYKHQGRDMSGLDCYGLIIRIYADLGIKLFDIEEDYDIHWAWKNKNIFLENAHKDFTPISKPKLFDIVAFYNSKKVLSHLGVMLDDNRFINSCPKVGTIVSKLSEGKWMSRLDGFYRHKGLNVDI
jgi:cell wall-associated NlpC family hydrolase